jgi:hypothetical protein
MIYAELVGNYLTEGRDEERLLAFLRGVVARDLRNLDSETTELLSQVKAFIEWVDDTKPEFATTLGGPDKFAALVELSRGYQECTTFYLRDVGVNSTTVWRWANGKSRPSKYIGQRVVADVKHLLLGLLVQDCKEKQQLVTASEARVLGGE